MGAKEYKQFCEKKNAGMRRYWAENPNALAHREKLQEAMKQFWVNLKKNGNGVEQNGATRSV